MQDSKEELLKTVEILSTSKSELEKESLNLKEGLKQNKPLKIAEEENERAITAIKHIGLIFDIKNIRDSTDFKSLIKIIEEKNEQLKEDLEKAEKFKTNKQKFVEMYEVNTKELQEE